MTQSYDLIVVGGGPAGSTVAALTKKYAPHLRVLLLEKARFPRHHVGESLLAGAMPVLEEMGAAEAVRSYGFVEKLGASFIWGASREPWGFEFDGVISRLAGQGQTLPQTYTRAWQVRRGEYDHLLLKHAAAMGVEVREGARVTGLRAARDGDTECVTGVEVRDDRGSWAASCAWLMDCTGQDALIGRAQGLREYDERMNNYALWGYWKGAKWKHEYVGHPNLSRIFIATTPRGWIWYIPVLRDTVSVGLVTHRQTLRDSAGPPEQLYFEELRGCPEIAGLLDEARLVRISPDQRRDVCAIQDWSYQSRRIAGAGWALCGDAAGFVDPILSSGVMLAHELGQKAAYTINSAFRAPSDEAAARYWAFYEQTYRTYLRAYRDMASFWYANNFSTESWWWQARRALDRSASGFDLTDREAFVRLASGYANRAESLSLFGSYPLHEAQQLVDGLFGAPADRATLEARFASRPPRMRPRATIGDGMYYWQGLVRTTRRVSVGGDPQRYLDLHPGEEVLVRMVDGRHTLADINRAAESIRALEQRMPVRSGTELLVQLEAIGALEPT